MATKRKKHAKSFRIFSSETKRHRSLIFGMHHLKMDLYQVGSYDAQGVKTGPAPGVKSLNKEGKLKNSSLKLEGLFGI